MIAQRRCGIRTHQDLLTLSFKLVTPYEIVQGSIPEQHSCRSKAVLRCSSCSDAATLQNEVTQLPQQGCLFVEHPNQSNKAVFRFYCNLRRRTGFDTVNTLNTLNIYVNQILLAFDERLKHVSQRKEITIS